MARDLKTGNRLTKTMVIRILYGDSVSSHHGPFVIDSQPTCNPAEHRERLYPTMRSLCQYRVNASHTMKSTLLWFSPSVFHSRRPPRWLITPNQPRPLTAVILLDNFVKASIATISCKEFVKFDVNLIEGYAL